MDDSLSAVPPPSRAARAVRFAIAGAAALLAAATLWAYAPVLDNGFVWDDDDYVTANETLRSLAGLGRIWLEPGAVPQYYPLTFTSLWLNYQIGGTAPFGYHLVNVLLHATSAVLLWRVAPALQPVDEVCGQPVLHARRRRIGQ